MVEKLKAVTAENLALHVAPDYEIAMASTWERKRKVHGEGDLYFTFRTHLDL